MILHSGIIFMMYLINSVFELQWRVYIYTGYRYIYISTILHAGVRAGWLLA